jgi:hypothetical protein
MDEDALERTAVHESGHAVIAHHLGLTFTEIELHGEFVGSTAIEEPEPHDLHVRVAVAGYAAVGAVLGAEAEQQNRGSEHYEDGRTDMERALDHAALIPGVEDAEKYVGDALVEVRDLISEVREVYAPVHALGEDLFHGASAAGLPRRMFRHDAVAVITQAIQDVKALGEGPQGD